MQGAGNVAAHRRLGCIDDQGERLLQLVQRLAASKLVLQDYPIGLGGIGLSAPGYTFS